ncbi:hypothetical protein HDU67_001312 [Dinochytrium kinnereticum]|nr:hypothetical protein HDU67_001312 [Dinochytrium kinnereticum]
MDHMRSMNVQLDESLHAPLICAYSDEDEAIVYLSTLANLRITRERRQQEQQQDPPQRQPDQGGRLPPRPRSLVKDLEWDLNRLTTTSASYMTRAQDLFTKGLSADIDFDATVHHAILSFFARRGNTDMAEKHLTLMAENDEPPTPETHALMIRAAGVAGDKGAAGLWFDKYRQSSLATSVEPYNAVIQALVLCGDVEQAIYVMSDIMPQDSLTFSTDTLQAFLEALLMKGLFEEVERWVSHVRGDASGQFPKIGRGVLEVAFCAAAFRRDVDGAFEMLDLLLAMPGGLSSGGVFAGALSDVGITALSLKDVKRAQRAFDALCDLGPHTRGDADPAFLISLIDHYGSSNNLPEMLAMLRRAKTMPLSRFSLEVAVARAFGYMKDDVKTMIETFVAVLGAGEIGDGNRAARFAVLRAFEAGAKGEGGMAGAVSGLTVEHFYVVFDACFAYPQGKNLVREMARTRVQTALTDLEARGLTVPLDLFHRVLNHFQTIAKDSTGASDWIATMRKKGVVTGPILKGERLSFEDFESRSKAVVLACQEQRHEDAMGVWRELASVGLLPNRFAVLTLVTELAKCGLGREVDEVLSGVLGEGERRVKVSRREVLEAVGLGYIYGGEFVKAVEIFNGLGGGEEGGVVKEVNVKPRIARIFLNVLVDAEIPTNFMTNPTAMNFVERCYTSLQTPTADQTLQTMLILIHANRLPTALSLYTPTLLQAFHSHPLALAVLDALCEKGKGREAMMVLDDIVDAHSSSKTRHRHPPPAAFLRVMNTLMANTSDHRSALHVYDLALRTLTPSPRATTDLHHLAVIGFINVKDIDRCLSVLDVLRAGNVGVPKGVAEEVLGGVCGDHGALNRFWEWVKNSGEVGEGWMRKEVLERMCGAFVGWRDVERGIEVFRRVLDSGDRPSSNVSISLIRALVAESRVNDAQSIFGVLVEGGVGFGGRRFEELVGEGLDDVRS